MNIEGDVSLSMSVLALAVCTANEFYDMEVVLCMFERVRE